VGPGSMSFEVAGKWQIQRKNVDLRARFPQVFYKLSTAAPTPAVLSCPARQPAADGGSGAVGQRVPPRPPGVSPDSPGGHPRGWQNFV
jgi:hypothetical protein